MAYKEASNRVEDNGAMEQNAHETLPATNPEIYHGSAEMVVDIGSDAIKSAGTSHLKLAKDGHTILIPQPSDDPHDPLNWSSAKKHLLLVALGLAAFIADYQAGAAVPCIILQGAEWRLSPTHVNYANNLNVLLVGIGGVTAMPFIFFWGRAPLMFWAVVAGTMFTLGCTLAPNFNTYYAMKALQGFTFTAGQTSGLAFIQDTFFFHEQARKIGIWTSFFLASPYCGPLLANFVLAGTGSWRAVFWLTFAIGCLAVVSILLFLDETWYRRDIPWSTQPPRGPRLLRLTGIWQVKHHTGYFGTVYEGVRRVFAVFLKPIMPLIMLYYLMNLMWAVGINQTSSILFTLPVAEGGYGFGQNVVGYIFFAPVVGVVLGEVFGHFFNDFIATRYIRRHNGTFVPEARLFPIYLSTIFMVPGLVLIGQALFHHLHWAAIVMGWGMFVFGYMVATVAVTAYALDSYPTASGEVSALINLARLLGGFSVGYFQLSWGEKSGYNVTFGVQAAIVAAGIMIIPFLHLYGPRLRHWAGPLKY